MKAYKFILILLFLLVLSAQAFKMKARLQQTETEETVGEGDSEITPAEADSETIEALEETSQETTTSEEASTTQESSSEAATEEDNNISLLSDEDTLVINRNDETTRSSEVDSISLNHQDMENLIKREYEKIRERFTYSQITLQLSESDQSFILSMSEGTGQTTAEDVISFLGLNDKFNDVHDLFSVANLEVTDFSCYYLANEDKNSIENTYCDITTKPSGALYKVESSQLSFESVRFLSKTLFVEDESSENINYTPAATNQVIMNELNSQDLTEVDYIVIYSGKMDYQPSTDVPTEDTEGMDSTIVTFYMYKTSEGIKDYDNNAPSFKWFQTPEEGQMTVNLLLDTLDQTRTSETPEIVHPRGLSSVNKLGLLEAVHYSESGKTTGTIHAKFAVPDFSFLPVHELASSNSGYLTYTNSSFVSVFIQGEFEFADGEAFNVFFNKYDYATDYLIDFMARDNSVFTFSDIKDYILPTLVAEDQSINILPNDEDSIAKLEAFGITEDETEIHNPRIEIILEPILIYTISGDVKSGLSSDPDMTLSADVLNLDGSPYSYMQFSFQSGASEEAFTSFFSIEESDGGAESFEITGFNFITTNRDLDLSQWDEIIQDDDVDLHMEGGIIAKEGIKATLDTTLIEDCGEYTLCRLFKESLVYSVFKFEGFLEGDETHLVSQIDDIPIKDGVTFTNSEFVVSIYGGESGATLSTSIEGLMNAKPEEDREIILQSTWNFGQHPQNNIEIAAYSDGIYSNVFELEVLGLTNMHSTATIFNEGHLSTFSLKGLGIFGYNCFLNDDLQESLNEQESRSQEEITDLSNEEQNEDGGVEILNQSCKSSYVTLDLEEKITSMIDFDYPEDILRTFVDLKTDDNAPSIINGISIPYGLSFEYTVEDAKKENPLLFEGQMDFLSIPGEGRASVNLEEEYALVNIDIPTVKLGGGNLQLISKEELFNLYGIRENDRRDAERKLDIKMDYNDLKKSNTIKFKLEKDHLIESRLLLETNILLFEMVSREITYLNEDFIAFRIEGNPFKGQFKARTSVELITVGSIVTEDNSVMRMEIAWDNNFRKLQHMTNELLQEWVYRTIELVEEIKALKEVYNSRLTVLEEMHVPVEDCETYEQCQELPSIICEEYAQQAECVLEQEVCISMIQECTEQTEVCTRTNSEGDCLDSITKCESWENICEDDETTTICLEFETQDIPDQCLRMELSCDSTELPDNQCVSESLKTEEEMDTATESIAILDGVLDSIKQLRDSSMCLVKRSKSDTVLEDCTTNDEEITNIRDVKILDLLEITSIISNMQLSQVISSDSIIFESNILLYGDWTNKIEDSNLDLVERSDLSIEEERTNEGYNSYAKSNVKVTHTLDFKDVELSSRILYDAIRAIICSEFGVYQEESDFIQTQITMFSLIDENSRICPQMQEYDLTGLSAGLYSEAIEETEEEINSEGFEAYTYEFSQGRDEIATSEEQIAQYNTLDYQERSDEDPQDVSIADAILDSSELDIDNSEIPEENNSDSLELDRDDKHNKNYRDRNELTDAEIRAKEEEQERKERESYSLTIHREQDEIDNNRDNSDAQEVEEVTPEETQTEEATETDEDPTDIHITSE